MSDEAYRWLTNSPSLQAWAAWGMGCAIPTEGDKNEKDTEESSDQNKNFMDATQVRSFEHAWEAYQKRSGWHRFWYAKKYRTLKKEYATYRRYQLNYVWQILSERVACDATEAGDASSAARIEALFSSERFLSYLSAIMHRGMILAKKKRRNLTVVEQMEVALGAQASAIAFVFDKTQMQDTLNQLVRELSKAASAEKVSNGINELTLLAYLRLAHRLGGYPRLGWWRRFWHYSRDERRQLANALMHYDALQAKLIPFLKAQGMTTQAQLMMYAFSKQEETKMFWKSLGKSDPIEIARQALTTHFQKRPCYQAMAHSYNELFLCYTQKPWVRWTEMSFFELHEAYKLLNAVAVAHKSALKAAILEAYPGKHEIPSSVNTWLSSVLELHAACKEKLMQKTARLMWNAWKPRRRALSKCIRDIYQQLKANSNDWITYQIQFHRWKKVLREIKQVMMGDHTLAPDTPENFFQLLSTYLDQPNVASSSHASSLSLAAEVEILSQRLENGCQKLHPCYQLQQMAEDYERRLLEANALNRLDLLKKSFDQEQEALLLLYLRRDRPSVPSKVWTQLDLKENEIRELQTLLNRQFTTAVEARKEHLAIRLEDEQVFDDDDGTQDQPAYEEKLTKIKVSAAYVVSNADNAQMMDLSKNLLKDDLAIFSRWVKEALPQDAALSREITDAIWRLMGDLSAPLHLLPNQAQVEASEELTFTEWFARQQFLVLQNERPGEPVTPTTADYVNGLAQFIEEYFLKAEHQEKAVVSASDVEDCWGISPQERRLVTMQMDLMESSLPWQEQASWSLVQLLKAFYALIKEAMAKKRLCVVSEEGEAMQEHILLPSPALFIEETNRIIHEVKAYIQETRQAFLNHPEEERRIVNDYCDFLDEEWTKQKQIVIQSFHDNLQGAENLIKIREETAASAKRTEACKERIAKVRAATAAKAKELEASLAYLSQLKAQLAASEKNLADLKATLADKMEKIAELDKKLERVNEELRQAREEIKILKQQREEDQKAFTDLQGQRQRTQEMLTYVKALLGEERPNEVLLAELKLSNTVVSQRSIGPSVTENILFAAELPLGMPGESSSSKVVQEEAAVDQSTEIIPPPPVPPGAG